jgi:hypothetical protein
MMGDQSEMMSAKRNIQRLFAAVAILTALAGCSMANYGQLKSDPEVTQAFNNYQILPDYKYFYRGSSSSPLAIVGIKEEYELSSRLWVQIDPKSKDFRALIDKVSLQGMGGTTRPWGFVILDPAGNQVGVWYSAIRGAAVEINSNKQIVNLSPLGVVTRGPAR